MIVRRCWSSGDCNEQHNGLKYFCLYQILHDMRRVQEVASTSSSEILSNTFYHNYCGADVSLLLDRIRRRLSVFCAKKPVAQLVATFGFPHKEGSPEWQKKNHLQNHDFSHF